ncbi:hypothetical protein SD70_29150 [Gordoniibacillus kamchatkensis]|uniref:Cyclase n=1 Tax=Gordoniibacillus kamchatkensis TaxID=1590651 RepID=A0ABR5AB22_9BACL|nr:cyclase family protein [Paenibacillus sp. VKM B-2647]KIL38033.1 hypothetical protein SD70_29150 [Paenibacillus sp. VKM B-2647]
MDSAKQPLAALKAAFSQMEVVDLTVTLEKGIPRWPSHPHLVIDQTVTHEHDGYYCQSVSFAEHTGTHMDAPYHAHRELPHLTLESVAPDALIGMCTSIDLSGREWLPGESAELDDVERALARTGAEIDEGDIVLINFGWLKRFWTTGRDWRYYADNQPGLTKEVADFLLEKRVRAVGTDTIAVGTPIADGVSGYCHFHQRVLKNEIYLMECLVNLELLPAKCFFIAAPLKIHNGSGSPVRALAYIPKVRQ